MVYKIAFAGDLHKKHKDVSSIRGYVDCCDVVQDNLIKFIETNDITHFVSLGDWYDRGYADDVASALADVSREFYMHRLLKGNFYGVIGNHIKLKLDSNPELMLIQPHDTIRSRKPVKRSEPIIKTPNYFVVGDVQISLVHFNKHSSVEEYRINRLPDIKYHIAVVHDPLFIPNSMLAKTPHPPTRSLDNEIARTLRSVDLCICGDIHNPLGMFDISPLTKMIVPGSLTNTNSSIANRHSIIKIPIITIDDELGTFNLSFYDFDLKLELLEFSEKAIEKVTKKLKTLRGNNISNLYEEDVVTTLSRGISDFRLSEFLNQQNYTVNDKELIKQCIKDPEDIYTLFDIRLKDMNKDNI